MSTTPPPPPTGGYQKPPGQPQWGPPPASAVPTNGKAVAAMVCGIASFVTCILPVGIAALVLGYISRREIDDSAGSQQGRGMAVAGIIMGWIAVGLMMLGVVLLVLLFVVGLWITPVRGF